MMTKSCNYDIIRHNGFKIIGNKFDSISLFELVCHNVEFLPQNFDFLCNNIFFLQSMVG